MTLSRLGDAASIRRDLDNKLSLPARKCGPHALLCEAHVPSCVPGARAATPEGSVAVTNADDPELMRHAEDQVKAIDEILDSLH